MIGRILLVVCCMGRSFGLCSWDSRQALCECYMLIRLFIFTALFATAFAKYKSTCAPLD